LDGVLSPAARRFQARAEMLRGQGVDLPDLSDAGILAGDWLLPHLTGVRTSADLRALDLLPALQGALSWEQAQTLDRLAPGQFETPLGRRVPIDYERGQPAIAVKLQEMFGVTEHPTIGPRRLPVQVTLLSPAGRPLQVTTDLPGFWEWRLCRGSQGDARPLPPPPLARGPPRRRPDAARQAAGDLTGFNPVNFSGDILPDQHLDPSAQA
jgi:HrpA-like RNA helicase